MLSCLSALVNVELRFTSEMENQLAEFAATTGRAPDELVQDALAGYFEELADLRRTLDSRFDDIKLDRVTALDGEAFFDLRICGTARKNDSRLTNE